MEPAYVLLSCKIDAEKEVTCKLRKIDEIEEICRVEGVYDFLIKIESATRDKIQQIVKGKICKIDKVRTTLSLMSIHYTAAK